ncbi:unnamed protein product [Phyllotreta striolata]|uniref:Proton-coupled folate transporter n=1 Tax=Phyllotreta striolata TaxID=444603 RepID=A0A9N9XNZ6_PHYSR|nr:unnamed protein product [Phyllotreta striolata]
MLFFKQATIELPLLLVYTAFTLTGSLFINLFIYRTCYVTLGYNESQCILLGQETSDELQELERIVQPAANLLTLVFQIFFNVLPIFVCIFAGPWSDKYGRLPLQLMSLIGLTLSLALLSLLLCFKNLSPWMFLLASIPAILTGSVPTYFTAVLSYLNDISSDDTRTVRMVIFEALIICGTLIGSLSSAPLLYATNYELVFFIGSCLVALGTLYTMFFVKESVSIKEKYEGKILDVINCSYVVDMFKVVFKKREDWNRLIIIIIFLAITIIDFTSTGSNIVRFQFLREQFSWTLPKFNWFNCVSHVITISGTIVGTAILNKLFKVQETVIALIGLFSSVAYCFLWGVATNDYYIYVGIAVAVLSEISRPMLRTRVAQIVPAEEMGKIFALIIGVGGSVSVGSTYLFTKIYNATIQIHPGSYNFLAGLIYCFAIFLVGVIITFEICSPNKSGKYQVNTKNVIQSSL